MRSVVFLVVALLFPLLTGCETTAERLDREADRGGLNRQVYEGCDYRHLVYQRSMPGNRIFVFIEGDGKPWVDGRFVAADPTPRETLAFDLMLQSDVPAVYIGRPCYFGISSQMCDPIDWTHARFSEKIVRSMDAVITELIANDKERSIVLIGYSGGAALAMLLAPRISRVEAVVTVAGLLDTEAWTGYHGYEPLSGSLNPADADLPNHTHQIHIIAEQDDIVPPSISRNAIARWPHADVWSYENFDHACCWTQQWTKTLAQIVKTLDGTGPQRLEHIVPVKVH